MDRIMNFQGKFADLIDPAKLHILSISVLLKHLKETRGGIAANIAYTLSLLGESPILYGSVGENARDYMQSLSHRGIDVSHIHWSTLPTATFTVMTDSSDCQVGGFYPGAMGDASSLSLKKFQSSDVFVVISAHDPEQMRMQVRECKKMGLRFFYDVGQQVLNIPDADVKEGIEACELLIVNDYEMGVITKKTGFSEKEIIQNVPTCVVTLGEKGSNVFYKDKKKMSVPSLSGLTITDPTGAGDAYRAGFLYGYIRGLDPVLCAKIGSVAAAYAIETFGTQEHHFTFEEFIKRYEHTYGKFPTIERSYEN